jgi:hypothetical protein
MFIRVDFGTENFLGPGNRQRTDLCHQLLLCSRPLLLYISRSGSLNSLCLSNGDLLGLFHNRLGAFISRFDYSRGFPLGFCQLLGRSLLCQLKVVTGAICSGKALGDFALALCHGGSDRRPNITHTKPNKRYKRDELSDQGEINVHTLLLWCSGDTSCCAPEKRRLLARDHKNQVHGDTDTNNGNRVNQTGAQEESAL